MSDPYSKLTERGPRMAVQIGALVAVAAAGLVALIDHPGARAVSALAVGVVALSAIKIGLVVLQRQRPLPLPRQNSAPAVDTAQTELAELRALVTAAVLDVERLAERLEPLDERLEHSEMLAQRAEPAIAEFVTLRHEALYLREAMERLRADVDS